MRKDKETDIGTECSVLVLCFSFDVGCWKFDVGRSSFKTTLSILLTEFCYGYIYPLNNSLEETDELIKIFVASIKTAKKNKE